VGNIEDRDPAYFWLRQTEELTLGDRRRTVEVAVPVRFGATPEQIARLLDEAVAGMDRLAERMERRITALRDEAPMPFASGPRPTTQPTRPAASIAERPSAPARPAASPGAGRPAAASVPSAASAPGGMSRAEFLEQARGLDLSPRQVMDRLGVRTLEGLNYAEALEQIKRQLLRESTQAPRDAASPAAPAAGAAPAAHAESADAPIEPAAPRNPAKYFDEEDDYDMTFELPDDDEADEDELDLDALDTPAASAVSTEPPAHPATPREADELDLDDVPDFAEPRTAARRQLASKPQTPAPAASPAAASNDTDGTTPSRPVAPMSQQALAQRARSRDLLTRLREYHVGSPAGSDQMGPFTHVVVEQLGEEKVATLTQQVWSIAPDQLTAQQMRALVQWGKTDPFAVEVEAVLDLLASEQPADTTSAAAPGAAARNGRAAGRPAGRGTGSTR
jgi:hypothetical protein